MAGKMPPSQVGMYIYRNQAVRGYESYDASGKLTGRMRIERDVDGHMVARVSYDGSGRIVKRFEYEVDSDGLMRKKTRYNPDNEMDWYAVYQYDAGGNRIEQRNYDRQNSPTSRITFYYDSNGERIRNEVFDAEDRPTKVHMYLYDEARRRVRDLIAAMTGEIVHTTRYTYGDDGFLARIEYFDPDGHSEGYNEIDSDSSGTRLEKRDVDPDGNLKSVTRYLY